VRLRPALRNASLSSFPRESSCYWNGQCNKITMYSTGSFKSLKGSREPAYTSSKYTLLDKDRPTDRQTDRHVDSDRARGGTWVPVSGIVTRLSLLPDLLHQQPYNTASPCLFLYLSTSESVQGACQ
jgi:hypothetical protein